MSDVVTIDGELYIQRGDVNHKVIKGWESIAGDYWFATELEDKNYNGHPLWFGFVQGTFEEWGRMWEGEMSRQIKSGIMWEIKPQDLPHAGRRY